jgi:ubiquinone/menaquinone biosynthesis C-methylase UbiE
MLASVDGTVGRGPDAADRAFVGAVPENYDRHLGPVLFDPFATFVARRVAAYRPRRVLELAAGTGRLTRRLRQWLPDARITATDLNVQMLEQAARVRDVDGVQWLPADAQALPFEDATFDLVISQFGVMFFDDRVGANAESRRVLADGGRVVQVIWDGLATNDFARAVHAVVSSLAPEAADFISRVPHGYHDVEAISADLRGAGLTDADVETVTIEVTADAADLAAGFVYGSPLGAALDAAGVAAQVVVEQATARLLSECAAVERGSVRGRLQAFIATARRG